MEDVERYTLRAREVAELTGIAKSTVYELARMGVIPCIRVSRLVLFPAEGICKLFRITSGTSAQKTEE